MSCVVAIGTMFWGMRDTPLGQPIICGPAQMSRSSVIPGETLITFEKARLLWRMRFLMLGKSTEPSGLVQKLGERPPEIACSTRSSISCLVRLIAAATSDDPFDVTGELEKRIALKSMFTRATCTDVKSSPRAQLMLAPGKDVALMPDAVVKRQHSANSTAKAPAVTVISCRSMVKPGRCGWTASRVLYMSSATYMSESCTHRLQTTFV